MKGRKMKLCELYFGDLEAFDEANNEREFFNKTYVAPQSLSVASLKNNRRFIVVGRKGAGKTAVQMHFADELSADGFFTSVIPPFLMGSTRRTTRPFSVSWQV